MEKFKGLYRIPSARWQAWDYRWDAAYFITACTKNRQHYFGEIRRQKMILSRVGVIAEIFWYETLKHARNIALGEFVVMPNHIHGILILQGNMDPLTGVGSPGQLRFQNPGKNSISTIVGSYKSAVSKHAHRLGYDFEWQPRFHDHVSRNESEYHFIANLHLQEPKPLAGRQVLEPIKLEWQCLLPVQ
jgi:putative transposase